jgi:signal transduction histidine kinase
LQRGSGVRAARRVSELEAILASMNEGLLILDHEGRIVSLNPPARAIFGPMGGGIILGQRLDREQWGQWPLGARAVAQALAPILESVRRGEARRDIEVELQSDGRRMLSFSSAPLADPAGQAAGGVVVFRDITSQREVARLKDELLSIASHDLRTPVSVMKCQGQLMQRALRKGQTDAEALGEGAKMIVDQADRLTHMLNTLLDLSRVEAGRLDLDLDSTDLVVLIRRVADNVQTLTTTHRIEVDLPTCATGSWDAGRLEQVMQNLLTNAIKYAPNGGLIRVHMEADDAQVVVTVRDHGHGIPPEDLPHLFEQFYRVAGTRKLEGSGLGLYICQGIISSHGGLLWAESDGLGCGSAFAFRLPREITPQVM